MIYDFYKILIVLSYFVTSWYLNIGSYCCIFYYGDC